MRKFLFAAFTLVLLAFPKSAAATHSDIIITIDMDPFQNPENTAVSVGSIESCRQINLNSLKDTDETETDSIQVDLAVIGAGIPKEAPLLAFYIEVSFPTKGLKIEKADDNLLLSSAKGSSVVSLSTPPSEADGFWIGQAADLEINSTESGPGVLERLKIAPASGAEKGFYRLSLKTAVWVDPNNEVHALRIGGFGIVAVNQQCRPIEEIAPEIIISEPNTLSAADQGISELASAVSLPQTGRLSVLKEDLRTASIILITIGTILVAISEIIIAIAYYKGKP